MNVFAVISEYNPFHNGHKYMLDRLRAEGATHIAAIMGGSFLQRGEPAFLTKQARTKCALLNGADLVIELPAVYATASAQRFAYGGCAAAAALGCVDTLAFGSESGDITKLSALADEICRKSFSLEIKDKLSHGKSYARAVSEAAQTLPDNLSDILKSPNNTLAIEYIRALNSLNSSIKPFTIKRQGAGHDSTSINEGIASASYIRELLRKGDLSALSLVPENCASIIKTEIESGRTADIIRLERAILYKLRSLSVSEIAVLPDVTEGLENRIYDAVKKGTSLDQILHAIKTKRYTHARIRRIVMYAFLGITAPMQQYSLPYLRVLGLNAKGAELLKKAKETAKLPVITKITDSQNALDVIQKTLLETDIKAADLQSLAFEQISPCGEDYFTGTIRLL